MFNGVAFTVFIIFFLLVTVLGFVAARWRRGNLALIDEWGLAGRRFGTLVTWFLLGGDLYTAYTFIAVPAAMFGLGVLNGWFAVPYTILVYPIIYVLMPRFWSVCRRNGYVTASDFVKERFGSKTLALAMAITGIVATLPYIALQMFGIQVSLAALGIPLSLSLGGFKLDLPLLIAFLILAAYTYTSGLRAPAMIAMVKDIMIFITLIVILVVIPSNLGGFSNIFAAASAKHASTPTFSEFLGPKQVWPYVTLALGSALALFLYPHSLTSVLSSNSKQVVKRNTALLPIYSLMLALLALTGYMAIAAHVKVAGTPLAVFGANGAVPALILNQFPSWFAGFAFAAISIGALVPASVMSIAAANLFTRNIFKEYISPDASARAESEVAKWASLVLKFGAVLFIVYIPTAQVINFQLLGGIWILQTLPAVFLGLYTNWFNRWALLIGWAVSEVLGTIFFYQAGLKSVFVISIGGFSFPGMYIAFSMIILNLVLALILTPIFNAVGLRGGQDKTAPTDYDAEEVPAEPAESMKEALG